MKKIVRAAALTLSALMAAGSLVSCGPFGRKKLPDKQVVDHVYKYEQREVYSIKNNYAIVGVKAASAPESHEAVYEQSSNENGYAFLINTVDSDYNTTAFTVHYGGYEGEKKTAELEIQGKDDNGYIRYGTLVRFAEGFGIIKYKNILVDADNYIYDQKTTLEVYGEDGQQKAAFDLHEIFGIDSSTWFSVNNILMRDGTLYLLCRGENGASIQRLGLDGKLGTPISVFPEGVDGYVEKMAFSGENELMLAEMTYNGGDDSLSLIFINLDTDERTKIDTKGDYRLVSSVFADRNGKLYSHDESGLYEVNKTTLEKTELMNYINSDYIYRYGSFVALGDGRFASVTTEYKEDSSEVYYTNIFTKVPDEDIKPKYIISVASAGNGYNLQKQIVEFNIASEEYRIKYTDYSKYNENGDYTLGQTRLSDDILAGNVPDILIADGQFSAAKYISKGLFADLYGFIDKDESMSREDFLSNILSGCEIGGKLYEIPTNFYIMGLIGEKDKIAEYRDITLREFVNKVSALPEGVTFLRNGEYTRATILQLMLYANHSDFINPETGKCSINNDEFRALLEYVNTLPEKSVWEIDDPTFDWDAHNNMYRDGRAIAMMANLYSFGSLSDYSYNFGNDVELDFIGVPSLDRDGMSFCSTDLKFLVSAKSAFPDAAWGFVKIFLDDDYQNEQTWGFPVKKSAFETMKQSTLDIIKNSEKQDESGDDFESPIEISQVEDSYFTGGILKERVITAEEVETVSNYATSVKTQMVYDSSLLDIISEEASAYFAGTKSLDEILPLMESRIGIFLAEGR